MSRRVATFITVGLLGFGVQISALALLSTAGWSIPLATIIAVELAVVHNFCWHRRWTWRERGEGSWAAQLARFHVTTGLVSLGSNVVLTTAIAQALSLGAVAANTIAVLVTSTANFVLADRVVFAHRSAAWPRSRARHPRGAAAVILAAGILAASSADAAPDHTTLAAWSAYVSRVEDTATDDASPCAPGRDPRGHSQTVPGGTIHRWTGCTVVPGVTVDRLLQLLKEPGTPPPQEDILESRVLGRTADSLRVYLKLRRSAVLTVTYDTEHDVTFSRRSSEMASSRSVATAISEVGGSDRGFLWRLNSYWRYRQVGPAVHVELESISLSRPIPALLRPVASPVVASVARESVVRALAALQKYVR